MKIRPIVIGLVVSVAMPLAGANAGAVVHPSLTYSGASTDLERGAVPTSENYGRDEKAHGDKKDDDGKDKDCRDKDDDGHKHDKSPSKPPHDCDRDHDKDHDQDHH